MLRAAPETPGLSNSLFNSFGSAGITCGTTVGGCAIAATGVASLPPVSVCLLAPAALLLALKRARYGGAPSGLLGSGC